MPGSLSVSGSLRSLITAECTVSELQDARAAFIVLLLVEAGNEERGKTAM
jgi:hypothetical protein